MIDYLYGTLDLKSLDNGIVVDVAGVGYTIFVTVYTFTKLPDVGNLVKVYVVEAVSGIYNGIISLYGFLSREERRMYLLIKDGVSGIGAKKAMEYVNKISKSFVNFKNAIILKDQSMLKIFGFTKKTADKLIVSLGDKILMLNLGEEKYSDIKMGKSKIIFETVESLVALGYKEQQAKVAVNAAYEHAEENVSLENLIRKSLLYL
ncbi:MAG: Holliday junction branch migration protein RuvA [Endomicrobium sp.]|nr:Holliday junction branch migration protein RuvA [Endomicrobium sp.]